MVNRVNNSKKKTIIFISGPTASGKTEVACELALRFDGEIVSCDSMQVYKGMDILTQASSEEITSKVRHYLVREIKPSEEFSASRFSAKSLIYIDRIISKGKIPVFAGGTGLYVKALIDGLFPAPAKDDNLRKELEDKALKQGKESLLEDLKKVDPKAAEKLHVNDTRRIIRALEVYKLTGETITEKKNDTTGIEGSFNCMMFGLDVPRDVLYQRINANVEKMFREGLVEEVKKLLKGTLSSTAQKALGLKEVGYFLSGDMTLEEAKEQLKMNTRRYAKRQLTWFRADKRIRWINADRPIDEIVNDISVVIGENKSA
jgi:tRNA dimethylallyltransferase